MIKRLFDILGSTVLLIIFSPLFLYVVYKIKQEDGGAVFYRGVRGGLHGKTFRIFKFRSMVLNADKIGGPSSSDSDPRITKIGKFIRKNKLDELAQLLNVWVGDMSFVGPRPEVMQYIDIYTEEEKAILTIRPGITDWASLWNADEGAFLAQFPDPDQAYLDYIRPTKLKLQLRYVRDHSLFIDLKILFLTAKTVVTKQPYTFSASWQLPDLRGK